MNVGYTNKEIMSNGLNNLTCPICGKDVYINKYGCDFACIDINCKLGHGSNAFMCELKSILSRLK